MDLYEQLAAVPTMPPTVPAVAAAAAAVTLAFLLTVVHWSTGHRVHGHDVAVSLAVAAVVGLATLGCAWSVHNDGPRTARTAEIATAYAEHTHGLTAIDPATVTNDGVDFQAVDTDGTIRHVTVTPAPDGATVTLTPTP